MKKSFKSLLILLSSVFISSSAMAQLSLMDLYKVCQQDFESRQRTLKENGWLIAKPDPATMQDEKIIESYWYCTPDEEIDESTPTLMVIYNPKTNNNWYHYSISDELSIAQFEQELTRFEKFEANPKIEGDSYNFNNYIVCVNRQKNKNPEVAYSIKLNVRVFPVHEFEKRFAK